MNTDQLRQRFPTEQACREFFEQVIWPEGRICPHCNSKKSISITGTTARAGLYQCSTCQRQFTVTTKTPMHSTKLCLWKWLLAMYYMVNSSKGVSSVFLAKWVGVSQKTAWKICHAIREMMRPAPQDSPMLSGIVELDEKYIGGTPRYQHDVMHKRGKATAKQAVFDPLHPYSKGLMGSIIVPEEGLRDVKLTAIPGVPPNLKDPPFGCRFAERCKYVQPECIVNAVRLRNIGSRRTYRCSLSENEVREAYQDG